MDTLAFVCWCAIFFVLDDVLEATRASRKAMRTLFFTGTSKVANLSNNTVPPNDRVGQFAAYFDVS